MTQRILVIARSWTSFKMFLKTNNLSHEDFIMVEEALQILNAGNSQLVLYLDDYHKSSFGRSMNELVKNRTDLVRIKTW